MTTPDDPDAGQDRPPFSQEELSNALIALAARLDDSEDHFGNALEKVGAAVLQLREQLTELLAQEAEKDVDPRPWSARATSAEWVQLVHWVDWMQASYGTLSVFDIYPCWPAHTGVVEELAGLYRSWRRAQIADTLAGKRGSNDLAAWHDRWLWPLLARLSAQRYGIQSCKAGHEVEVVTVGVTDRQLVPGWDGKSPSQPGN